MDVITKAQHFPQEAALLPVLFINMVNYELNAVSFFVFMFVSNFFINGLAPEATTSFYSN